MWKTSFRNITALAQNHWQSNFVRLVVRSSFWLALESAMRNGSTVLLSFLLARFWSTEIYGEYAYVLAVSAILFPLAKLGLDIVVLRDVAQKPQEAGPMLGTYSFLRGVAASFLLAGAIFILPRYLAFSDSQRFLLVALGASALLQSLETGELWFHAHLNVRALSMTRTLLLFVGLIGKALAVYFAHSLVLLGVMILAESVVLAGIVVVLVKRAVPSLRWRVDSRYARHLLKTAFPLVLAAAAAMIHSRADQIILTLHLGPSTLAQYALSLTIVEALALVPLILLRTVLPAAMQAHTKGWPEYQRALKKVYKGYILLTILEIFGFFTVVYPLVAWIFGGKYVLLASLLPLMAGRLIFTNLGLVRTLTITSEGLFYYDLVVSVIGSLLNVTLNFVLIPWLGVYGVLVAFYSSLLCTTILIDLFHPKLRQNVVLFGKSLWTFPRDMLG